MNETYLQVATEFAQNIETIFQSEETLKQCFQCHFPHVEFSRTDHWNAILRKELYAVWKVHGPAVVSIPTQYDVSQILWMLLECLDYNLFTQVLMNLQSYAMMTYSSNDAKTLLESMQASWSSETELNPFAPKAKMIKAASTDLERRYNLDLSSIKASNIIAKFTPMISFRVSPKGSTPAFADSQNLSMMGAGGDRFLKVHPQYQAWYITWGVAPPIAAPTPEGTFITPFVKYPFTSKSGGDILNEVLFSRFLACQLYEFITLHGIQDLIVLPRMNSVLVVAPRGSIVPDVFEALRKGYDLELAEGTRS